MSVERTTRKKLVATPPGLDMISTFDCLAGLLVLQAASRVRVDSSERHAKRALARRARCAAFRARGPDARGPDAGHAGWPRGTPPPRSYLQKPMQSVNAGTSPPRSRALSSAAVENALRAFRLAAVRTGLSFRLVISANLWS